MSTRNSNNSYGAIAKSLHWIVALLIVCLWCVGTYMVELTAGDTNRTTIYGLHKTFGMIVLMLAVIRVCWRVYDRLPQNASPNPVIMFFAHLVHLLLYIMMFIMPLSGWIMSSAAGYHPTLFGLYTFPAIAQKSKEVGAYFHEMHEYGATILLVLFGLHVAGALFHHIILRDNALKRML